MKHAARLVVAVILLTVVTALGGGVSRADDDVPPILSPLDAGGLRYAVRLDPPAPPVLWTTESANGRCVGFEFLLGWFSPGWLVERMSRIMYRESRCDPTAARSDSGSTGLLQILSSHCQWLARQMGEPCTQSRLLDPTYNIRAGAVLWSNGGYQHWAATS